MASVTTTTTGTTDAVHLQVQAVHRLDIDVPSGISAISYTLETTNSESGEWKTLKQPGDLTTDLTMTESMALAMEGQCFVRLNVASLTGSGTVTLTSSEARTT